MGTYKVSYRLRWPGLPPLPLYIIDPETDVVYGSNKRLPPRQRHLNRLENRYVRLPHLLSFFDVGTEKVVAHSMLQTLMQSFGFDKVRAVAECDDSKSTVTVVQYVHLSVLLAFVIMHRRLGYFESTRTAMLSYLEDFADIPCRSCGFVPASCQCTRNNEDWDEDEDEECFIGYATEICEKGVQTDPCRFSMPTSNGESLQMNQMGIPGVQPLPPSLQMPYNTVPGSGPAPGVNSDNPCMLTVNNPQGGYFRLMLPPGVRLQPGTRIPLAVGRGMDGPTFHPFLNNMPPGGMPSRIENPYMHPGPPPSLGTYAGYQQAPVPPMYPEYRGGYGRGMDAFPSMNGPMGAPMSKASTSILKRPADLSIDLASAKRQSLDPSTCGKTCNVGIQTDLPKKRKKKKLSLETETSNQANDDAEKKVVEATDKVPLSRGSSPVSLNDDADESRDSSSKSPEKKTGEDDYMNLAGGSIEKAVRRLETPLPMTYVGLNASLPPPLARLPPLKKADKVWRLLDDDDSDDEVIAKVNGDANSERKMDAKDENPTEVDNKSGKHDKVSAGHLEENEKLPEKAVESLEVKKLDFTEHKQVDTMLCSMSDDDHEAEKLLSSEGPLCDSKSSVGEADMVKKRDDDVEGARGQEKETESKTEGDEDVDRLQTDAGPEDDSLDTLSATEAEGDANLSASSAVKEDVVGEEEVAGPEDDSLDTLSATEAECDANLSASSAVNMVKEDVGEEVIIPEQKNHTESFDSSRSDSTDIHKDELSTEVEMAEMSSKEGEKSDEQFDKSHDVSKTDLDVANSLISLAKLVSCSFGGIRADPEVKCGTGSAEHPVQVKEPAEPALKEQKEDSSLPREASNEAKPEAEVEMLHVDTPQATEMEQKPQESTEVEAKMNISSSSDKENIPQDDSRLQDKALEDSNPEIPEQLTTDAGSVNMVKAVHSSLVAEGENMESEKAAGKGETSQSLPNTTKKPEPTDDQLKKWYARFEHLPTGQKLFRCTFEKCRQCFDTRCAAKLHSRVHAVKEDTTSLVCPECDYRAAFFRWYDMLRHLMEVHAIRLSNSPRGCHFCGLEFVNEEKLVRHIEFHYSSRFKCVHCGLMVFSWKQIEIHMDKCPEKNQSKVNFGCPFCMFVFHKRNIRNLHMLSHCDQGLKCVLCSDDVLWDQWKQLRKHYQQRHSKALTGNISPFRDQLPQKKRNPKCSFCKVEFRGQELYNMHMVKAHDLVPYTLFGCSKCPKTFRTEKRRDLHLKNTHDVEVQCDKCNFVAKNKTVLRMHSMHKHVEKQHVCTDCDKAFTYYTQLRVHMAHHARKIVHTCKTCEEVFPRQSELRRHQREDHAPAEDRVQHQCLDCDYICYTRTALKQHVKKEHPREADEDWTEDMEDREGKDHSYFNKKVSPPPPPRASPKGRRKGRRKKRLTYRRSAPKAQVVRAVKAPTEKRVDAAKVDRSEKKRLKVMLKQHADKVKYLVKKTSARTRSWQEQLEMEQGLAEAADSRDPTPDKKLKYSRMSRIGREEAPSMMMLEYPLLDHSYCKMEAGELDILKLQSRRRTFDANMPIVSTPDVSEFEEIECDTLFGPATAPVASSSAASKFRFPSAEPSGFRAPQPQRQEMLMRPSRGAYRPGRARTRGGVRTRGGMINVNRGMPESPNRMVSLLSRALSATQTEQKKPGLVSRRALTDFPLGGSEDIEIPEADLIEEAEDIVHTEQDMSLIQDILNSIDSASNLVETSLKAPVDPERIVSLGEPPSASRVVSLGESSSASRIISVGEPSSNYPHVVRSGGRFKVINIGELGAVSHLSLDEGTRQRLPRSTTIKLSPDTGTQEAMDTSFGETFLEDNTEYESLPTDIDEIELKEVDYQLWQGNSAGRPRPGSAHPGASHHHTPVKVVQNNPHTIDINRLAAIEVEDIELRTVAPRTEMHGLSVQQQRQHGESHSPYGRKPEVATSVDTAGQLGVNDAEEEVGDSVEVSEADVLQASEVRVGVKAEEASEGDSDCVEISEAEVMEARENPEVSDSVEVSEAEVMEARENPEVSDSVEVSGSIEVMDVAKSDDHSKTSLQDHLYF